MNDEAKVNWPKLNRARARAMLVEAEKVVELLECTGFDCTMSPLDGSSEYVWLSEFDGIIDFWTTMLRALLLNGAMAPGGHATKSAQKAYLRFLARADKAVGRLVKDRKKLDARRIRYARGK